jgi:hypothetical protein
VREKEGSETRKRREKGDANKENRRERERLCQMPSQDGKTVRQGLATIATARTTGDHTDRGPRESGENGRKRKRGVERGDNERDPQRNTTEENE